ncbi:Alanine aminotransferase 2 [Orchesella cincta]|uniref:alanine transaminase n=1 Tax=Orchesella cincta TaxID=48709 RepID=A0A1D2NAV9_ORCCI|nr:Alanine aminotransferase 2 [Orchesella cincta]
MLLKSASSSSVALNAASISTRQCARRSTNHSSSSIVNNTICRASSSRGFTFSPRNELLTRSRCSEAQEKNKNTVVSNSNATSSCLNLGLGYKTSSSASPHPAANNTARRLGKLFSPVVTSTKGNNINSANQLRHLASIMPCYNQLYQHEGLIMSASASMLHTSAMANGSSGSTAKTITLDNMNPHIKTMEYAVRGPLVIRATEIEKELAAGAQKPFKEVIKANIGDAHAMGQRPITFIRQVLALVSYPELIDKSDFPADVKKKASEILAGCKGGSAGSYSDSSGIEIIRKHAAEYITRRDGGIAANPDDIILCAGASEGIRATLKLFVETSSGAPGVMIPIPQYPLYSASLAEFGMHQVGYYLDEARGWALDIKELERSIKEARGQCNPRALVVINPGNPTGQVLTKQNIEEIIKFAHKEGLFILADEVYQDNVYASGSEFHSFKKVMMELGAPYNTMELASYFSTSKGYMGECGLRGGYSEVVNLDKSVKAMLLKSISAKLCPTVLGQATMDCVVDPPQKGSPSYDLFIKEKTAVLQSLAQRASKIADTFNSIPGIKCNPVQGAMYAFPQITLPQKAIDAAKAKGQAADTFYAFELLENTGICIVPGTGFGQYPGTYHFRTTILPQPEKLAVMLDKFQEFHVKFVAKYS